MPTDDTSFVEVDRFAKTQRTLAALWVEVLQLQSPPSNKDDFFALGGNSMGVVTLEFRIQEELPVHLTPGTLLGAPTLGELTHVVDALIQRPKSAQGAHPSGSGNLVERSGDQS